MNSTLSRLALAGSLLTLAAAAPAAEAARVAVRAGGPAVRVAVRVPAPSPRHVWVAGAWYVPPRPHAVWVEGRWACGPHGRTWVGGHWR